MRKRQGRQGGREGKAWGSQPGGGGYCRKEGNEENEPETLRLGL